MLPEEHWEIEEFEEKCHTVKGKFQGAIDALNNSSIVKSSFKTSKSQGDWAIFFTHEKTDIPAQQNFLKGLGLQLPAFFITVPVNAGNTSVGDAPFRLCLRFTIFVLN
ncbi:hypothetical protein NPIL_510681 [Nephila pilipes]|uniref:Uncharacterized protein n=1 Tax=Nephila pilipes TaxID=299642 RepID=A0A8X6UAN2_NEPPI|nr:hypothetical protein NPIL_510681 [Nephila pilipes]